MDKKKLMADNHMHAKGKRDVRRRGRKGRGGRRGYKILHMYHMSDSGQAFSCLSTSGADQGIVPYMLEVFDVQSKCSWIKIDTKFNWVKVVLATGVVSSIVGITC